MTSLHEDFTDKMLAAKAGNPAALASLGVTYFATRSMPTDIQAAAELLNAAADQGDAEAQSSLGAFYFFGIGVDRNEHEAVKWFRRAAEQGHADAQHRLGSAYRTTLGFGVTPNDAEAVMWFRKAASQGHAQAQYDLARQLLHGEGVAKDATEAVNLWKQLAQRGHPGAQAMLGRCYATGDGVAKNLVEAATWLRKAADQGYPQAKEMLANVSAGRTPMKNFLSGIGSFLFGMLWFAGIILLFVGGAKVAMYVEPWIAFVGAVAVLVGVPICLVLLIPPRTREWSGLGFYLLSWPLGIWVWIASFVYAMSISTFWAILGIVIGGIGVVPIAVIMTLIRRDWPNFGDLAGTLVVVMILRWLGLWIASKAERRAQKVERNATT